jgi:hypothetical protein
MGDAIEQSSHIPFKRGDAARKRKILELLDGGMGPTEIAKTVGGSEAAIRKVRKSELEKERAQRVEAHPWYQSIADKNLAECSAAARKERPKWSTVLADAVTVRDITETELKMHTYPHTICESDTKQEKTRKLKAGRTWMRDRLTDFPPRPHHHGFVIFPPSPDINYDVVNTRLPKLLDDKNYQKILLSIFQSVQGKDGKESSMGDKKRKQAKMSALLQQADQRKKEAKGLLDRYGEKTVSAAKKNALDKLRETEDEKSLLHEASRHMCENFIRIQEVSQILLCN